MKRENRPLGRGLDNLLGEASGTSSINEVNIDSIQPNPDQPRRAFDEESWRSLLSLFNPSGWCSLLRLSSSKMVPI